MKTFDVTSENGKLISFEIDNTFLSLRTARNVIHTIDGAEVVYLNRFPLLNFSSDIRLKFRFRGTEYLVTEPYGDNSRLCIFANNELEDPDELPLIRDAFSRHKTLISYELNQRIERAAILGFGITMALVLIEKVCGNCLGFFSNFRKSCGLGSNGFLDIVLFSVISFPFVPLVFRKKNDD